MPPGQGFAGHGTGLEHFPSLTGQFFADLGIFAIRQYLYYYHLFFGDHIKMFRKN